MWFILYIYIENALVIMDGLKNNTHWRTFVFKNVLRWLPSKLDDSMVLRKLSDQYNLAFI